MSKLMYSVLINAYACSPGMGSEPGMGWNWCVNLAKHCKLHIITEGEFKEQIEEELLKLPQSVNMTFYYNPVSEDVRKMCWNQGDWRFYWHYNKWQKSTYQIALDITKKNKIDIIHQLNMIGFREPGYLWKIKDYPFVWGPVDAKESFPTEYLEGASFKTVLKNHIKNWITVIQLKYSGKVKKAVKSASEIVSASSNSKQTFSKYYKVDSILLNETGCKLYEYKPESASFEKELNLLWVGKFDFRKQLGIAIKTLTKVSHPMKLHVVGSGENQAYIELAKREGVEEQIEWYGQISHESVQKLMRKSDLLFFTSVSEGTPHVVLEALSNSLPVVCFNTCGQGDSINDKVGVKIELSKPSDSVNEFAIILDELSENKYLLKEMTNNCKQRAVELSWENKISEMIKVYNRSVAKNIKSNKTL